MIDRRRMSADVARLAPPLARGTIEPASLCPEFFQSHPFHG